jgi:hypothetical protein
VEEWKTCNVKIGGGTPGHSSLNIWLEQLGGRLWLRKVKESKYLDFTLSNILESDDVAEECGLERAGNMSETVDIINEAALAGGNGLTLVRKIRDKHVQFAKLEGTDGTLCVYLFLTEKMVKLVRRKEEKTTHHTYKEALMSKSGPAMFIGRNARTKRPESEWVNTEVKGDDWEGLNWILAMHSKKQLLERRAIPTPSEGVKEWAREKFRTIGAKGKMDLLKYLAVKAKCEFRVIGKPNSKGNRIIKRSGAAGRIAYQSWSDIIVISKKSPAEGKARTELE